MWKLGLRWLFSKVSEKAYVVVLKAYEHHTWVMMVQLSAISHNSGYNSLKPQTAPTENEIRVMLIRLRKPYVSLSDSRHKQMFINVDVNMTWE